MGDAVDESKIILCCAVCCANCGIYPACDSPGCSGKIGLCGLNIEMCCKPGAPFLPCLCCGPKCECGGEDGCTIMKAQQQCCCISCQGAFPPNEEVPLAVTILGCTLYPNAGCCVSVKSLTMDRSDYQQG
mmetsp:Transcript_21158/g.24359  ORF Transcript_21158/g.24359 Transcript_21158/m.24359 type:complete len:130 (-) Transcript_21158:407-796(-)